MDKKSGKHETHPRKAPVGPYKRLVVGAITITVSIVVSYAVVRALTQQHINAAQPDRQLVRSGNLLRIHANALEKLLDELRADAIGDTGAAVSGAETHVKGVYQPQLRELRSRMLADATGATEPGRKLLAAVDRCLAMTAHFGDLRLRELALNQAALAVADVESFIFQHQLEHFLREKKYISRHK